jgi:hypothetical protein
MAKRRADIVKTGGVAKDETETEDVTRDTYGFGEAPRGRQNRKQRVAEADRAAGAAGVPGVDIPRPTQSESSDEKVRADEFQRVDGTGDRAASPGDLKKVRP